jgi:hypothetical protein
VVEGSQQIAIARYVMKSFLKIEKDIDKICHIDNLDGQVLTDALTKMVTYFNFDKKVETAGLEEMTLTWVWGAGNTTGICSAENAADFVKTGIWPDDISTVMIYLWDGVYQGIGMKIPTDKMETQYSTEIALDSWKVVYLYYWVSFCILIACSICFLVLIRRHKADLFDFVSIIVRLIAFAISATLIALVSNDDALYTVIQSPILLPIGLFLLCLILFFDKVSAAFCNWRLRKSGASYALEAGAEHGHGDHDDKHGHAHEHDEAHESLVPDHRDHRKSTAWSVHGTDEDLQPLTHRGTDYSTSTEYTGPQSYAMSPMMSPPMMSPPVQGFTPPHGHGHAPPGGYQPVGTSQNYGA